MLLFQDIACTIASVLQLMGAHDPVLVIHGTAFLLNVSANSVRNKVITSIYFLNSFTVLRFVRHWIELFRHFYAYKCTCADFLQTVMVADRAPDTLLSVLNHRNSYLTIPLPNVRQLIASISDNVLICLANLTRNQDECGKNACLQVCFSQDVFACLTAILAADLLSPFVAELTWITVELWQKVL